MTQRGGARRFGVSCALVVFERRVSHMKWGQCRANWGQKERKKGQRAWRGAPPGAAPPPSLLAAISWRQRTQM